MMKQHGYSWAINNYYILFLAKLYTRREKYKTRDLHDGSLMDITVTNFIRYGTIEHHNNTTGFSINVIQ